MEHVDKLWNNVLQKLQEKIAKPSFDTWFGDTKPVSIKKDLLVIETSSIFVRDWLTDKYTFDVSEALYAISGEKLEVKFISTEEKETAVESNTSSTTVHNEFTEELTFSPLNPKYIFETFVVGSGNRFAHAASLAVAESPGKAYNPLFIYGGVGLGKTHLLQAIGHFVKERRPDTKIVYLSSEKFMNEFINSISENKSEEFRQKYRKVDVLLIDDIQFFERKVQTQEEFFHTFNALYEDGKQIVITSDRPPKEIQHLEDRLRSRFSWGLITDITAPDLETRIAILQKKARSEGLNLSNEVILYIANSIDSNIRELEGALIRIVAYSSLMNQDIDENLATEALKNLISETSARTISVLDIMRTVGNHYHMRLEDFKSKKRTQSIAFPRQIAMYLSRELTDLSLPKIGSEFGGRDHTTVIHACEKINSLLQTDATLQQQINSIKKSLQL